MNKLENANMNELISLPRKTAKRLHDLSENGVTNLMNAHRLREILDNNSVITSEEDKKCYNDKMISFLESAQDCKQTQARILSKIFPNIIDKCEISYFTSDYNYIIFFETETLANAFKATKDLLKTGAEALKVNGEDGVLDLMMNKLGKSQDKDIKFLQVKSVHKKLLDSMQKIVDGKNVDEVALAQAKILFKDCQDEIMLENANKSKNAGAQA